MSCVRKTALKDAGVECIKIVEWGTLSISFMYQWPPVGPPSTVWTLLDNFRHSVPFWTLWALLDSSGPVGPFLTRFGHIMPLSTLLDFFDT